MLALGVFDIVSLMSCLELMLESLFTVLSRGQYTVSLEESLLEIFTLKCLKIEISLQAMI